jgi:DNA-binding CsgD family transcriptional regulator
VSSESRELTQRFHRKQVQLASKLSIEPLPRQKDHIRRLKWGATPLNFTHPRFGALETQSADRPRSGCHVSLAQDLHDVDEYILDWVLWREALLNFLLPHLRHVPEAADLGLYAGLQYGGYKESVIEALTALWKQVSPPQHYQHYIYDGPFGFPLFDQVVSGTFLHRVIPWLNTLRPTATGTSLLTSTYTAALERWMLETHIPLTESEHNILLSLSRLTKPLHQSRLADQLNMSISGLSQHLTNLAQRHALRLNHFINLPLIGLTPYELLIHTPNHTTRKKIINILNQIPYTWFINPIQHTRLHSRIFIPTSNATEFQDWLTTLARHYDLPPIELFRTGDIIQTWNLSIYLPNHGWPNDLTYQLYQMHNIFNDQYESPLPTLSLSTMSYALIENSQEYPIALRPEDFTYFLRAADIHRITDRITPQASKELRQAGITDSAHMVYRRRIKQLEKMQIGSTKGMWMLHIGLDTIIQLYIFEHRTTTLQIINTLQLLPRLNGLVFDNGYGVLFILTPNEIAVDVLSFIRKLILQNNLNVLIITKPAWQASSGFGYPVNLNNYNFNEKGWKWERTTLPNIRGK